MTFPITSTYAIARSSAIIRKSGMLQKNFKILKRSISDKILGKQPQKIETVASVNARQSSSSSQSSQDEEDPYREILRNYNDNVSHLVFHGSSLKSMSSVDFSSISNPRSQHMMMTEYNNNTSSEKETSSLKQSQSVSFH
uniref:Uncharacterized protein n=1 Tax=Heterorhabditis bacteriophora TaxID=37862 RepID=A0A1I7XQQ2_HETBA